KEDLLKAAQVSLADQEAALRARCAPDEETLTRQVDALKTRHRALEREILKTRETLERSEKDHAAVLVALKADSQAKEEELTHRCDEQEERLKKRLDERKISLEAFLTMKKSEETRLHAQLRAKEKERAD